MDQVIVAVYLGAIFLLGMLSGRKMSSLEDFSVGGKQYSLFFIFATVSATYIGGGFSLGNAEKVYLVGIANVVVLMGFSFQQLLTALFLVPKLTRYPHAISVGDIMGYHYGKVSQVITGICAFFVCAGILAAQIAGIGYIFKTFLGIPHVSGIFIGAGIVLAYSTVGGMKAVVLTDVIQFVLLILAMPLLLVLGIKQVGGISALAASVPPLHLDIPGEMGLFPLIMFFFVFFFGEMLVPPSVQRLLLSTDMKKVQKANLYSGFLSFFYFAITGTLGLVALALLPGISPSTAIPSLVQVVLPIGIQGLVIAGIISVVMSSSDSFLNSATVAVVNDIIRPLRKEKLSPEKELKIARAMNFALGALAVVLATRSASIMELLIYAYQFWAPMIIVPLVGALLRKRVNVRQFYFGAGAGFLASFLWQALGSPVGIDTVIIGVAANLLFFLGFQDRDKGR